jgi:hypothetical protein
VGPSTDSRKSNGCGCCRRQQNVLKSRTRQKGKKKKSFNKKREKRQAFLTQLIAVRQPSGALPDGYLKA